MRMLKGAFISIALLACSVGLASDPPGIEGQDWARQDVILKNGVHVKITGINQTVNTIKGNTSTVIIEVNNIQKLKQTIDAAYISRSIDLSGDGRYTIVVQCLNHHADAGSCAVDVEKIGPQTFE